MHEIVKGRELVTIDRWSVKRVDGGFILDPHRNEFYGYGGPALFTDLISAHEHIAELGMVGKMEAVPVLVEIREVTREEFKDFQEKERRI
jgi:hypothetical protein